MPRRLWLGTGRNHEPAPDRHEKSGKEFREIVKKHFDSWCVDGRFGLDAVKELFPDLETYDRLWNSCFPKLKLTHQWGK